MAIAMTIDRKWQVTRKRMGAADHVEADIVSLDGLVERAVKHSSSVPPNPPESGAAYRVSLENAWHNE